MMSYGIRIWKKAVFPSLLFLIAAVYLFGSAFHLKRVVRSEQKQSFGVTVSINREEDVQALLAMKEVKGGSALYEIPATISSGIYSSDLVIQGIDSSMIPGILIEGERYAEAGSMPYLILNESALKTFVTDDAVTVDKISWLRNETTVDGTSAKICGIIKDKSNNPAVYMSVKAAKSYMEMKGQIPLAHLAVVELKDAETVEQFQEKLLEMGYDSNLDENQMAEWKIEKIKIRYQVLAGVIALLAFISTLVSEIKRINLLIGKYG